MITKRIAVVAEWLTSRGGAEEVLKALFEVYPEAALYTSVFNTKVFPEYIAKKPKTSFLQKIPILRNKHQWLALLLPLAMSLLRVKNSDLIISISSSIGKFVRKSKGTIHVCYCNTPMRYAWQTDIDNRIIKLPFGKLFVKILKKWDLASNNEVDYFIGNSNYTSERIKRCYGVEATTIYPPVEISKPLNLKKEDFYICLSRLVPYKKFDLAILAANRLNINLKVCGVGPELNNLKKISGPTIEFMGRISDQKKLELLSKAKGLIFPSDEDFGIVPIEALSQGTPVIAFGKGGSLETVIAGQDGIHFDSQTVESLCAAIQKFETMSFDREIMIKHAEKFSKERFKKEMTKFIENI